MYSFSFSELEKLFPISFIVDPQGRCVQLSLGLTKLVSTSQEVYEFDKLFRLKNNSEFLFSFEYYKLNQAGDFIFEGVFDKKEYWVRQKYLWARSGASSLPSL